MTEPVVVDLRPEDTHALRRAVLRADTPSTAVQFPEDVWPGALHLGLEMDGEIVAVSTWVPRELEGEAGVQLRGMATAAHLQGHGLGSVLLAAGCARVAAAGHELVWARARDTALDFYVRHGFAVRGDGFVDATTLLAHHVIVRRVAPLPSVEA